MKYHIRFKFSCEGEPPSVYVYDSDGMTVLEVFEEPLAKKAEWSWTQHDWTPGPFADKVLELLNSEPPRPAKAVLGTPQDPFKDLRGGPNLYISNCALAHGDTVDKCQMCGGQCPDRQRFEPKTGRIESTKGMPFGRTKVGYSETPLDEGKNCPRCRAIYRYRGAGRMCGCSK